MSQEQTMGQVIEKIGRSPFFSENIPAGRFRRMLDLIPRWPGSISDEKLLLELERSGFAVSKRTVQRDLEGIREAEPELGLDRKIQGKEPRQWFFKADAPVRISPSLDDHTALAFQLASTFISQLMPPATLDALKPFVREAEKRLSHRHLLAAARWKEKVHVFPLGLQRKPPTIRPEVRDVVYQAILNEQSIRITHVARNAKDSKVHLISPLGLVIRDYLIYLVATMNKNGTVLQFGLHRSRSAELAIEAPFVRPDGFVLRDYAEEKIGYHFEGSADLQLELRLGKQGSISVRECPLAGRQTLSQDPDDQDAWILSADVPNSVELRQWIRSLGPSTEVLAPGFLRAEFADEIAKLAKRYGVIHVPPG